MHLVAFLVAWCAVVAGTTTQLTAGHIPREVQHQEDDHNINTRYVIGEVIANEFDRHVPVLSDNLRGELHTLRNDINRQFDSLKHHMDVKLDRMQRDAPAVDDMPPEESRSRQETPSSITPAATIRHNLAMAELRRLGAELTQSMNEEVGKLREEFRTSLEHFREQIQNSTDGLADKLGDEFSSQAEESTTVLKKVFFLTRNQMTLIQNTLDNINSAIMKKPSPTTTPSPPEATEEVTESTTRDLPSVLSTLTDISTDSTTIKETIEKITESNINITDDTTTTTTTTTILPTTTTTTTVIPTTATTTTTTSTTMTKTTESPEKMPKDCTEALMLGMIRSGVTKIKPSAEMKPKKIWCDQTEGNGGWTVMLWRKKQPTQIDFRRSWQSYVEGFGDPDGEYWIGLETLYKLTKGNPYSLRVEMTWDDEEAESLYDYFSVGPAVAGYRGYKLNVGGYNKTSTGGDALIYHNSMEFSTYDQDNDGSSGGSCSEWSGGGGWWFNYCYYSNPTGIYPPSDLPPNTQVDHLLEWRKWQGYYTYLSSFRMMIRPN